MERDHFPDRPSATKVERRLDRTKVDQELHLNTILSRIQHLKTAERKVWKEIREARNQCFKRQEVQLLKLNSGFELEQLEVEEQKRHAELIRAAEAQRAIHHERCQIAWQATYERKAQMARDRREESIRAQDLIRRASVDNKLQASSRVEDQHVERAQAKHRRQVENTQKDKEKKLRRVPRLMELEETLEQVSGRINEAEQLEMACMTRLQNSLAVQNSVMEEIRNSYPPATVPRKAAASAPSPVALTITNSVPLTSGASKPRMREVPATQPSRSKGVNSGYHSARPQEKRVGGSPELHASGASRSISSRSHRPLSVPRPSPRSRSAEVLPSPSQVTMTGTYDVLPSSMPLGEWLTRPKGLPRATRASGAPVSPPNPDPVPHEILPVVQRTRSKGVRLAQPVSGRVGPSTLFPTDECGSLVARCRSSHYAMNSGDDLLMNGCPGHQATSFLWTEGSTVATVPEDSLEQVDELTQARSFELEQVDEAPKLRGITEEDMQSADVVAAAETEMWVDVVAQNAEEQAAEATMQDPLDKILHDRLQLRCTSEPPLRNWICALNSDKG